MFPGNCQKPAASTPKANKLLVEKHIGKIGDAKTVLPKSTIAIGHTRWATHGRVTDANAHPHLDCRKKLAVIHNGIVENYLEFKQNLIEKGHKFTSETDTEVIAHLIEDKKTTSPSGETLINVIFDIFNSLVGSNAIGVIDLESETIIACRNGSPWYWSRSKK
jgi:glucosamine--fructose-6-phosphate aminotransferase (isomerizing)